MVTHFGWHGTCLAYATFHLVILLPAHLFLVPRETERQKEHAGDAGGTAPVPAPLVGRTVFFVGLLAAAITLSAMISTFYPYTC